MSITKKDVQHIAKLARLSLTSQDQERFTQQLARIIEYIDQLQKLDTEHIEPLAQPLALTNVYRDDTVEPSGLEDAIIRNAPEHEDRFFKVKKVIE
ncbi:MAG: Asp-tRNA(Asn)/Glu-tRNA(Gln) amidotransferase subunit GatC [Elusimicrobia bacterium]|nr:Asp-tRNA(Asn)/Glu-tRNA(Gln) amidotransferase subunit GatC [Elusimicrobiota bacterium]MBD3412393.1 Asp-tRNA(Asn)/Glu-tRNA(Gln) amidotransferase subunit GatC [Elusimicrobiota bacterium]